MNIDSFYNIIDGKQVEMSSEDIKRMEYIQYKYPFFQIASTIYSKILHNSNSEKFKNQLTKTAVNVYDRESLFDFIFSEYSDDKLKQNSGVVEKLQKDSVVTSIEVDVENKVANKISNNKTSAEVASIEENKAEKNTKDRGDSLSIIEKFIKSNPGISKPGDKDYSKEINIADQSIEENYNLVSETMANLYSSQGHNDKAIKIYEKLILIFPEKSTYFAARISELKE